MRAFDKTTLSGAVGALGPGMRVLMPPGCGEPVALVEETARHAARLADLTLMGGIHLGDYPYARPESSGLRVGIWPFAPGREEPRSAGRLDFVPVRYFEAVSEFAAGGEWAADAVLVHCAPPDDHGYLSLGVSVGVVLPAARRAPLVIAQVNPNMPRTRGNASLHRSQIDRWVEVDAPLLEYPPPAITDLERAIGRHVASVVPDRATVQVGVGAIPQAVLEALGDHRDLGLHSLLADASVALVERGVVTNVAKRFHRGRMDIAEAMGTRRLFDFVHDNVLVNMESSAFVHDPSVIAQIDRFVAVNSALEIDLTGQVTAESLGPRQVAGIGGQFDFVLGASRSRGGVSVIAMPSTGRDGTASRIVTRLSAGAAVTTPRYLTDRVVTEFLEGQVRRKRDRAPAAGLVVVAQPQVLQEPVRRVN